MLRNQLSLLFVLLLSTTVLFAQSNNSYFTVLVGTFTGNRPDAYQSVEKMGFLFAKERPNQVFDVYIGGYDTAIEAAQVLDQIKKAGFSAAKIQQYVVRDNQAIASIQIASFEANVPVNWNRYQALSGDLFVIPNDNGAKLLTGFYPNIEAARKELPRIQAMGFSDAFVRTAHPTFLHQIGGFETGSQPKDISATAQIGPKKTNVTVAKPTSRPQPTFLPVDYQLNPNGTNSVAVPGINDNKSNPITHANPSTNNGSTSVPPANNPPAANTNRPAPNGNGQGQFKWDSPGAQPANTQTKSPNQIPVAYEASNQTNPPNTTSNSANNNTHNNAVNNGTSNPNTYNHPSNYQNPSGAVPNSYNYNGTTAKGGNAGSANNNNVAQNNAYAAPMAVYRASVKELQQALVQEGAYRNVADGYYNPATEQAYAAFSERNRLMSRYTTVAKMEGEADNAETTRLNNMLNQLDRDANPVASLARINHPLSKAYMAYHSFTTRGSGFEANNYMNGAIREVFSSRNVGNQISFDTRAAYAYTDLRQMVLHLYYMHAALGEEYPLPCWLNDKHPNESAEAQGLFNTSSSLPLPTQSCEEGNTNEQNSSKILQLLAEDIGVDKADETLLKQAAEHRKQLYAGRVQLGAAEQAQLDSWSAELLNKLNIWSAQDPLHGELVRAFRVVFYQNQMELENHYMAQGLPVPNARYLALATQHTLLSPYLQRFE
jgi:hypothetical protein